MKTIIVLILTILIAAQSNRGTAQSSEHSVTSVEMSDNLIEAVSTIDIVSLNVLLADGEDVNMKDQNGNTPLMIASKIGNPRILKIILAHNPELNLKNNRGYNALMIAAENGQTHVVQQLIEQGAHLYAKNAHGFTLLEIAKRNGHADIVDLLKGKTELVFVR